MTLHQGPLLRVSWDQNKNCVPNAVLHVYDRGPTGVTSRLRYRVEMNVSLRARARVSTRVIKVKGRRPQWVLFREVEQGRMRMPRALLRLRCVLRHTNSNRHSHRFLLWVQVYMSVGYRLGVY